MTPADISRTRKFIYPLLLAFITLIVCITNYTPGTWLSGWDNLHPEMNYGVYWNRILHSVWQEHQGLGAVATQAHASEIPRVILLQFLDIFLPQNFVRWAYAFLMLFIGPLGIYYLSLHLFDNDEKKKGFAFLAGLYYLLNWGTLQHFYAPLEMFLTLYGYIGWLFLFLLKYLKSGRIKDYLIMSFISLLAAPMAHTPTLWFAYLFFVGVVSLLFIVLNFNIRNIFKGVLVLISNICVNAFWLFPTIYFALTHADDVANAKITRLFSEEALLHNQEYANILNIAILKGYLFNWLVFEDQSFKPIFISWLKYFGENSGLIYLGYFLYIVILIGLVGVIINRSKNYIYFLPFLVFSTFFLLMNNPPLGFAFEFLQNNIPLFKEALRLPFTKFSIQLMLAYSLFLGYGANFIYTIFAKLLKLIKLEQIALYSSIRYLIIFCLGLFIIVFSFPALTGNLIGRIERVDYPDEYFEAFDYLNTKKDVRIATLPAHFLFGWLYFDWQDNGIREAHYQGAGFTWFMSKNPILEREFDRWFPFNEDFYNEYQYAVYAEDAVLLKNILNKYQVNYIFYDKSVTVPYSEQSLNYEATDAFLTKLDYLSLDKQFKNIKIYKFKDLDEKKGYIYAPSKYVASSSSSSFSNIAANETEYVPNYYTENKDSLNAFFPFSNDESFSSIVDSKLNIDFPSGIKDRDLILKVGSYEYDNTLPANIILNNDSLSINYIYPKILNAKGNYLYNSQGYTQIVDVPSESDLLINSDYVDAEGFSVPVYLDKVNTLIAFEPNSNENLYLGEEIYSAETTDCAGGDGEYGKEFGIYPDSVIVKSLDKNACLKFNTKISNQEGAVYEVSFDYRNSLGSRALYCLEDEFGSCINSKYINAPYSSEEFINYTDYVYIPDPKNLIFSLIIETQDKSTEQSVEFKNIYLRKHPLNIVKTFALDSEALTHSVHNINVSLSDFPISIDLSDFEKFNHKYIAGSKAFNSIPKNCDSINDTSYDRTLEKDSRGSFYRYKSIDAISCDIVETKEVNLRAGNLISFETENIAGKALDICALGKNINKCFVQDRLTKNNQTFVLQPYEGNKDVSINISAQSIGNIKSENKLYSINAQYLPYKLLKMITIGSSIPTENNSIKITDYRKISVDKYAFSTDLSANSASHGLIILNQAYEPGWGLYYANECTLSIKSAIFCTKVNAEHVIAKGWANGWVVASGKEDYLLVFWPQLLQTVGGFVFSVFTLAILLFLYLFPYKKD
jgi:hypothetical protein